MEIGYIKMLLHINIVVNKISKILVITWFGLSCNINYKIALNLLTNKINLTNS